MVEEATLHLSFVQTIMLVFFKSSNADESLNILCFLVMRESILPTCCQNYCDKEILISHILLTQGHSVWCPGSELSVQSNAATIINLIVLVLPETSLILILRSRSSQ